MTRALPFAAETSDTGCRHPVAPYNVSPAFNTFGFRQDSREQVDAFYRRVKADGFDLKPPHQFHGAWTTQA